MKLFNHKLELKVIRTMTSNMRDQRQLGKLLMSVDGCFHSTAGRAAYARIRTFLTERQMIIGYDELMADPVLDESVRRKLDDPDITVLRMERLDSAIRTLNKYRSVRAAVELSNYIVDTVTNAESIDVDKFSSNIAEKMVGIRHKGDVSKWFTSIGGDDRKDVEVVTNILNPDRDGFYPTGFQAFDGPNHGLPVDRMSIMASTSGAGKSILVRQMAHNLASIGASVCIVPLEMDAAELMQRNLSSWSGMKMSMVTKPRDLSESDKRDLMASFKETRRRYKKSGGSMVIFEPEEDLTIEEILFALEPFNFNVIIVDYVGLLKGTGGDDQWRLLQGVTRFSHQFAKNKHVHVCLVAQLNDDLSLALSRGMKRDAALMWKWSIGPREKQTGIVPIHIEKARNQRQFTFLLKFDWDRVSVYDLTDTERDEYDSRSRNGGSKDGDGAPKRQSNKREEKDTEAAGGGWRGNAKRHGHDSNQSRTSPSKSDPYFSDD